MLVGQIKRIDVSGLPAALGQSRVQGQGGGPGAAARVEHFQGGPPKRGVGKITRQSLRVAQQPNYGPVQVRAVGGKAAGRRCRGRYSAVGHGPGL